MKFRRTSAEVHAAPLRQTHPGSIPFVAVIYPEGVADVVQAEEFISNFEPTDNEGKTLVEQIRTQIARHDRCRPPSWDYTGEVGAIPREDNGSVIPIHSRKPRTT